MPANDPTCSKGKIDSNIVGLSFAEEKCIGVLPDDPEGDVGDQAGGKWFPLDPNEFDDFGGEITTTARNPINASRQRKKGSVTDLEASGGFNLDVTQNSLPRLMQGFFFANARERVSTHPINDTAASKITLVNVVATGSKVNVGTDFGDKFAIGMILKLSGMANAANNRIMVVTAISDDELTVSGSLTNEDATANSKLEIVGYQFGDSVAGIVFTVGEKLTLTRSSGSFVTDGYNVGEWLFIGGDTTATKFTNNAPGYARIEAVTAGVLTLREPTWTPITEAGASGKTVQIFFGTFLRNENDPTLIRRRSYQFERSLGQDADGIQSEYLVGAVANEFTLNLPSTDKMMADLSYVALNNELRTGAQGLKPGDRTAKIGTEDAYNVANDIYQLRLFVTDPLKATPKSLYAKVMEGNLTISNGATGLKALGTLGSFEINVGDFVVGGELEVYFSTIEAVRAVKNNADVGFNLICSKDNAGFVYDIPLLSLAGGLAQVEKDEPIMLPLEKEGAENDFGYTMSATYFSYLPTVAMATTL